MRETISSSISPVVFDDAGSVCGLNLGAGYCAEHEWGIRGLEAWLGVGRAASKGIDKRKATKLPDHGAVVLNDGTDLALLVGHEAARLIADQSLNPDGGIAALNGAFPRVVTSRIYFPQHIEQLVDGRLKRLKPRTKAQKAALIANTRGYQTAWCDHSFLVVARGEEEQALLQRIISALRNHDLTVSIGGTSNPFARGGLCLIIASEVPPARRAKILDDDEDHEALMAAFAATGIEERLRKAGCQCLALSPNWLHRQGGDLLFWLNPMSQSIYHSGYVCLADLEAWAEGTGHIVKGQEHPMFADHVGYSDGARLRHRLSRHASAAFCADFDAETALLLEKFSADGALAAATAAGLTWAKLSPTAIRHGSEDDIRVYCYFEPTPGRPEKASWIASEDLTAWLQGKGPLLEAPLTWRQVNDRQHHADKASLAA